MKKSNMSEISSVESQLVKIGNVSFIELENGIYRMEYEDGDWKDIGEDLYHSICAEQSALTEQLQHLYRENGIYQY